MATPVEHIETDKARIAAQFINGTGKHVFLTGKAGTGKTTFLKRLAQASHKKFIIVAPTGIAALNAGGVTIHSQFLLPLGSYHPGKGELPENLSGRFYNSHQLIRRHPLNSARKQVLRDIDLLIIDEVSMLRADVLDAIDHRLRNVRRDLRTPFGGVQLLFIGDLFQLPPIVKDYEWNVLKTYYPSPHFFSALALKDKGYVYIELDKVFRQRDEDFIRVLNHLRTNSCTQEDIDVLNSCYKESYEQKDDIITLTTHNYQADKINESSLDALKPKAYTYKPKITGDFPEHLYPLPAELVLKVGAQVMFIKNDSVEQRFYNGKLARVISLDSDSIRVKLSGEDRELTLEPMQWQNKKYSMNDSKEVEEEVIGSFEQYPIKLAWAITVHKSQGLTFERAVVDVGQAFAPGQVYVALSRLTSLEGLVLRTKISNSVIRNDSKVLEFSSGKLENDKLEPLLRESQAIFLRETLVRTFNFDEISSQITYVMQKSGAKMEFSDEDLREALPALIQNLQSEKENTKKFRNQIRYLLQESDYSKLESRVQKGSEYYLNFLFDLLYQVLLHQGEVSTFTRTKAYVTALSEVDHLIMRTIAEVQKSARLTAALVNNEEIEIVEEDRRKRNAKRQAFLEKIANHIRENPRKGASKSGRRKKKKGEPTAKGATYEETYRMIKEGMNAKQIAIKRSMAESTIEGHIARGIKEGKVQIEKFMDEDEILKIRAVFDEIDTNEGLSAVYAHFKGKVSYGKLRMIQALLINED